MGNFKIDDEVKENIIEPLPEKENEKIVTHDTYKREVIVKKTRFTLPINVGINY